MRKLWLLLSVALLASMSLWGCGSSRDSVETNQTVSIADASWTGNCTICHTIDVHTFLNGIAGVNPDANGLGSAITHECEACHGGGQYHHGVGPIPYPSPDGDRCATCHDQATKVIASTHNYREQALPSMVSSRTWNGVCQRCHTAEGYMALKSVSGDDGTHNAETALDVIVANGSTLLPGEVEALPSAGLHNAVCGACHNPLTKAMNTADPSWTPNGSTSAQFALCTSCHFYKFNDGTIAADGGTYTVSGTATPAAGTYTVSTGAGVDGIWFNSDDVVSTGTLNGVVGHHPDDWYRAIASTHFDNPDSPDSTGVVEGYVIRENSANPCFDCHGHELRTNTRRHGETPTSATDYARGETIFTEWAQSAHAGHLLKHKEAAPSASPLEKMAVGAPWEEEVIAHYNWDSIFKADGVTKDRADCQMCHTSTGFVNYVTDSATYDPTNNDFSHLASWSAIGGSPQNEMLYCWGCHIKAEEGTLRATGAVTATYTYDANSDGIQDAINFPDVGASNTCLNCHTGRGNAQSSATGAVSTSGYGASHHAVSGAVLFSNLTHVGGEYIGQDYSKPSYFEHDILGTPADDATGNTDAGPCAVCHMNAAGAGQPNHTFNVVEKDETTGQITALVSEACVNCHTGAHGAALVTEDGPLGTAAAAIAFLQEESDGYQDAGTILNEYLANTRANYTGAAITASSGTNDDHRAFQNSLLPGNDAGAYAHNRYYAKRLMFDSIDWVDGDNLDTTVVPAVAGADGNNLDGEITLNPATDADAIAWFGGDAVTGVCSRP